MNYKSIKKLLSLKDLSIEDKSLISKPGIKKIPDRTLSYTERHRGTWFKPEYDLEEIQIAQDTDSFLFRALKRKTNRFLVSGWEIVGENPDTVSYIKERLSEIEYISQKPWNILLMETAHDLFRYSNCMWVKARSVDSSSGNLTKRFGGKLELEPVAGYFILPFETLSFKTKKNGEIKKIRQRTPSGEMKEFSPYDVIHFYDNKKPGFAMGTPEILPVLDDIALLRRLEENIESLVESNLYPLFHYQVGTDEFPERYSPEGLKETDIVKQTIEYMPAGGVYVSDHRHKISAIGSEGKALSVEKYLDYFKKRIFSGLGVSAVDMGEGDTANRSTANALSKMAIQDVQALQGIMKMFIEFYVFNELLLEGKFDPLDILNKVEIKFGVVDREEKGAIENQTIQLYTNNLISEREARKLLGYKPELDQSETHFELHTLPLAELKSSIFGTNGTEALSNSISRPENQHGKLTSQRIGKSDFIVMLSKIEKCFNRGIKDNNNGVFYDRIREKKIDLKIDFLQKLELLLEEDYNHIIKRGVQVDKIQEIYYRYLSKSYQEGKTLC